MEEENRIDILKVAELLNPPEESLTPEDELPSTGYAKVAINNTKKSSKDFPRTLEEFDEQLNNEIAGSCLDGRIEPLYEIKYRQAVTAEDIFLQMGPKTPSSACCEDMVVSINLTGETFSALDLKLLTNNIKVNGLIYKLDLDLPHSIDPNRSKAKWIEESETLIITLRIVREFDFINF